MSFEILKVRVERECTADPNIMVKKIMVEANPLATLNVHGWTEGVAVSSPLKLPSLTN